MSRLNDIKWDDGHGLDELSIWGPSKIEALGDVLAQVDNNDNISKRTISNLGRLVVDFSKDLEEILIRFMDEMEGDGGKHD